MSSNGKSAKNIAKNIEPFDLGWERDVPTTAQDVESLWKARRLKPMSPTGYQEWADLIFRDRPRTRSRNTDSDETFEL